MLRSPQPSDVDALFEIQGDPKAMQFTYCAPDREATARHLEAYASRFPEDGYAPWTAILKQSQSVVGWGGLNRDPGAPQWGPEVSYFLHPSQWGRGLARELVAAALELAFAALRLEKISGFTMPANLASARVLRKAAFSYVGYVPELERDHYSLTAEVWRSAA